MPETNHSTHIMAADDAVDLKLIARRIWRGKWIILAVVAIASIASVMYALSLPNVYRAYAILAPNQQEASGGLSALASQYSGLASIAGVNLGTSNATDKVSVGLEILNSRKFISEFIVRHDMLIPVMAANGLDLDTGELTIAPDIYNTAESKWIRKVSSPKQPKPTPQEAQSKFRADNLSISQDKKTGFVTIAITYYSPELASNWINWLIDDLNQEIMEQDVNQAEQAIDYLNTQIEATSLSDLRNVFFRLIEEQTKTIMLAKVTDQYLLKTLDPATPPQERHAPKRAVIVILSVFAAGALAVLLVLGIGSRKD